MAWTPFSAEAIVLEGKLHNLRKAGRSSEMIDVIVKALEKAYSDGPSNMTYEAFEAELKKPVED